MAELSLDWGSVGAIGKTKIILPCESAVKFTSSYNLKEPVIPELQSLNLSISLVKAPSSA